MNRTIPPRTAADARIAALSIGFLSVFTAQPSAARDPAAPLAAVSAPAPSKAPPVSLLRDDPALRQKITVEVTDRPLRDVFKDISPSLKADLVCDTRVADQRVTLRLTDRPVYDLMTRLPQLLSHSAARPRGYHWEKLERSAGARPGYRLWRDIASLSEEESLRDSPRRRMAILLREIRDLCRLTPEQRDHYTGELPKQLLSDEWNRPYRDTLAALSDTDLDALLDGQSVPIDPALYPDRVARYRQMIQGAAEQQRESDRAAGLPDPYPNGLPDPPPPALLVKADDYDGRFPERSNLLGFFLEGISTIPADMKLPPGQTAGSHFVIDINQPDLAVPYDPLNVPDGGPVYDLGPLLKDKAVTDLQRRDLGFTLQALAKVTGLSVCQEAFLQPAGYGLNVTKGTQAEILGAISDIWDCHVEKADGDLLVWDRKWVQRRQADVPQRLIDDWRRRIPTQGDMTPIRSEISASLTWLQVRLTLNTALPEAGGWGSVDQYRILRLLGNLTPSERDAAASPSGLALADMLPWQQQSLAEDFRDALTQVTDDQLTQAVLTVSEEPSEDGTVARTTVRLITGQQTLLKKLTAASILPPSPVSSTPGSGQNKLNTK